MSSPSYMYLLMTYTCSFMVYFLCLFTDVNAPMSDDLNRILFVTFAMCMTQAIGWFSICFSVLWICISNFGVYFFCHMYFLIFESLILSPASVFVYESKLVNTSKNPDSMTRKLFFNFLVSHENTFRISTR